jgi:hypothetical protein
MFPQDASSLTDSEWEDIRLWLKAMLKEHVITVSFTKKDGTDRIMVCTTNEALIPKKIHATNTDNPIDFPTTKSRAENLNTMSVYDLEKGDWRSFTLKSVKSITFNLKDGYG